MNEHQDGRQADPDTIQTEIWCEVPDREDPFVARKLLCRGYDVMGEILPHARYGDYLCLLLLGQQPSEAQSELMNALAIALANPGPRDHSVQAAMSAGAGGSTAASTLMAAVAVGAGGLGGAREIHALVQAWTDLPREPEAWHEWIASQRRVLSDGERGRPGDYPSRDDVWMPPEHLIGFHPQSVVCNRPVTQLLDACAVAVPAGLCAFVRGQRGRLEEAAGRGLAFVGAAAAGFVDLGCSPEQAEMLYLLLRLPGAAVHGLEQRWRGWKDFPFYRNKVEVVDG